MAEKLTRPKTVLDELFDRIIATGGEFRKSLSRIQASEDTVPAVLDNFELWDRNARTLLEGAFTGPGPANAYPSEFNKQAFINPDPDSPWEEDLSGIIQAVDARLWALKSIRDMLGMYEEPSEVIRVGREHPASHSSTAVFIVHGHSEAPKQQVARFLETGTNSTPIILHEQAKRGRVIIETLEEFATTAAFAIVLLTADDHGGLAGSSEGHPRARQNVVFELGFFIGALGRSRVAVLYEEAVELPSDMNGILYTILDSGGAWKLSLGRELRAAGFAVDLNLAK